MVLSYPQSDKSNWQEDGRSQSRASRHHDAGRRLGAVWIEASMAVGIDDLVLPVPSDLGDARVHERRAWSRRKRAMRNFRDIKIKSFGACGTGKITGRINRAGRRALFLS
jgi:hypothetical protein